MPRFGSAWMLGAALLLWLAPAFGQVTNYPAFSTAKACAADPPVGACIEDRQCFDDTNDILYVCDGAVWVKASARVQDDTTPKLSGNLDVNGKLLTHATYNETALALEPYTLGSAAWVVLKNGDPGTAPGRGPQIRPDYSGANTDLRITAMGTGVVRFEKAISADNGLSCTTCIDISSETNLAVTAPITLTGDTVGFDATAAVCSIVAVAWDPTEGLSQYLDLYRRDIATGEALANIAEAASDGFNTPRAVTVSDLGARVSTAVASGQWLIEVVEDGVQQLTCTIASGVSCTDSGSATVATGAVLTIKITPTGPPTASTEMKIGFCVR